jgi:predicted transglutaminase-like cysteine proteinase
MLKSLLFGTIAITALSLSGTANAMTEQVAYAKVLGEASMPIGWAQFCADPAHRQDCNAPMLPAKIADLDERRWRELLAVNHETNRDIEPVTDMDHWGVAERWSYPTDGKGDCEDYVLEKRRKLMAAGWPRQALLITVVRDKKGEGHAVLTVRTDRGDFILDNQEKKVKLWADTGYLFIKRQSEENPNRWVSLGNIDTATAAIGPR